MITHGRKQRVSSYKVYDFTNKRYFAGEHAPGTPAWSPFRRDGYRCRERKEAEQIVEQHLAGRLEHRILEIKVKSY